MTRLAVLADIHGNLPALEAVLHDLALYRVDHVVVAGDVINWGPFSAQVVERITREGWTVVRGNNELYLLDYGTPRGLAEWNDISQYPMLPWLARQLNGQWKPLIASWPETIALEFPDAPSLRVIHGTPASPWAPILPTHSDAQIRNLVDGVAEPMIITGHTHLAMDRQVGRWRVVNPGSVGVPLDGHFSASYLLLASTPEGGWKAAFRRIPFDYAPLYREFERQRFLDECGIVGRLVVEEFKTARVQLAPFLRWRQACCPDAPLTMALLAAYANVDPREYTPAAFRISAPRLGLA